MMGKGGNGSAMGFMQDGAWDLPDEDGNHDGNRGASEIVD